MVEHDLRNKNKVDTLALTFLFKNWTSHFINFELKPFSLGYKVQTLCTPTLRLSFSHISEEQAFGLAWGIRVAHRVHRRADNGGKKNNRPKGHKLHKNWDTQEHLQPGCQHCELSAWQQTDRIRWAFTVTKYLTCTVSFSQQLRKARMLLTSLSSSLSSGDR